MHELTFNINLKVDTLKDYNKSKNAEDRKVYYENVY